MPDLMATDKKQGRLLKIDFTFILGSIQEPEKIMINSENS